MMSTKLSLAKASITVSLLDSVETLKLVIEQENEGQQIGTSYKVEAKSALRKLHVKPGVSYFLKVPDPVESDHLGKLRERFKREWHRGGELNDLAVTIRDIIPRKPLTFGLPRMCASGLIIAVGDSTESPFCGLPYILYEWDEGRQLDVILDSSRSDDRLLAHDLRAKWFDFAKGLAQIVGRLHNHGFLHACIAPRNILVTKGPVPKCTLAGFGYSSLSIEESIMPSNPVQGDAPFQAPEFSIRRELGALWHPSDIFSVGAVLLYLATSKVPKPEEFVSEATPEWNPRDVDHLKDWVRSSLVDSAAGHSTKSDLRTILQNENVAKIIDNCLRYDPDDRIGTAEELLEALDTAQAKPFEGTGSGGLGPYFTTVLKKREADSTAFVDRLRQRHHFELYGSRTAIIEGLCRMLGGLGKTAVYRTVTLPSYWTSKNLGPDGRFLAMNRYVARRDVKIERIFLVSGPFHTLSDEEQQILRSQQAAHKELAIYKSFRVKVHVAGPSVIHGFEREGKSVAFIAFDSKALRELPSQEFKARKLIGRFVCLNFISRGEETVRYGKKVIEREIRKVRIWDPGRGEVYWNKLKQEVASFDLYWNVSGTLSLDKYIKGGSSIGLEELLRRGAESEE